MDKPKAVKRRNPAVTKARILAAAQKVFAERGYAQTGLRDIANEADVSSALPVTYFGTKAGLFEAALEMENTIQSIVDGDEATINAFLRKKQRKAKTERQ
jgi:AcrR family transcriptional regulator